MGYGNYALKASADIVVGETFIVNNNRSCLFPVRVGIVGDVTGPNGYADDKVDMRDIGAVCRRFITNETSPDWNPDMDINDDGIVNMPDIALACANFGAVE